MVIRKLMALVILGGLALMAACSREPKERQVRIALIPKGTTHEFWKGVQEGGMQAGEELDVRVLWRGPLREDDRNAQIETVENMINLGVDALVLAPLDNVALRAPARTAQERGIPLVIIDSDLDGDYHAAFVATDNRAAGRKAGDFLAERLEGKGRVILLRYQEGSASTMHREQGFLDAVGQYPEIEVVSENQYAGPTTESAYQASENLLAPLRSEEGLTIDGIFCPNESTTFGMLRALQDSGLAGAVQFVGFDSSSKLVEALEAGTIDGLVLQDPVQMGYLGVKTAVAILRGEPYEETVDTGSVIATPANMQEDRIRTLLGQPE